MFFTGDSTNRKRVDLGGRSSKERDRQKLLEQTRLERKRRLGLKQETLAAIKIQKCFRGRKAVEAERLEVREQFCIKFGERCEKVDRHCFGPESEFLRQLLFFFSLHDRDDFIRLAETCRVLHQFIKFDGNVKILFAGDDLPSNQAIVENRVKRLTFLCLQAIHHNRAWLKDQLLMPPESNDKPAVIFLEAIFSLTEPGLPWVCKLVEYVSKRNAFGLLRDIILTIQCAEKGYDSASISSLERALIHISSHVAQPRCVCPKIDPRWSFPVQILTIPLLWKLFPCFMKVFATQGLSKIYVHEMALFLPGHVNYLPPDGAPGFPGYACLLGNLLEAAGIVLSQPNCEFQVAVDFSVVAAFLLDALPPSLLSNGTPKDSTENDDIMDEDGEHSKALLSKNLEKQIFDSIDSSFLKNMVSVLFRDTPNRKADGQNDAEIRAIGAVCAFLHMIFTILPLERIMTGLAYTTELVPLLWKFIKCCHENQKWPSLSELLTCSPGDAPGWLLPLSVFCPVYRHMLMIIDNEEFYEQERPLSLQDIRVLITFLKEALWQLLWVSPGKLPSLLKAAKNISNLRRLSVQFIQHKVSGGTSELLAQLQDWNNRRQFTSPNDFHAREAADELFVSQAINKNTRARDLLKQAPFLVPFTSRVQIYTKQLATARQSSSPHPFPRHNFTIRRDHIVEDGFSKLSLLSAEDLKGMIRVTFVNELGVEEAGIDGGGIFKDFMENITRAAFDVQYGLFKETVDHLLFPNPASGMIHGSHLEYFRFLGNVLGKAMFEGILVDIPFATFFLSKLKQKHNYLHDLPSLDPELYKHLLFLKHYKGDISELGLYFVIVNNEYGEQTEEELLPGGRDIQVTNENVIMFIHLIANHRLNIQIRQQSLNFLQGFQQLIQPEWIAMFNEHELQLLISGSLEGMNVDDLRSNTHYTGGYHEKHPVVEMFWEVVKNFSSDHQKKFLKFVTGCSRGPLLGFKYLEPQFCVQRAAPDHASEYDLDRLPTSATCMNLLKLPPYNSKEKLETKLIYAINADAGFDLS
ncbi:hypothetical protein AMTRI_Chr02g262500 [Amborella trichopoda]